MNTNADGVDSQLGEGGSAVIVEPCLEAESYEEAE